MIVQRLLHYQFQEDLGEGGMGVVYNARDTHLDRFVAIRVLAPEKVAGPERKRRFVQEAKADSALNHPNTITVYDVAEEWDTHFIAMEWVEGKTLSQFVARKHVPWSEAYRYAIQRADALAAAHGKQIVHRDLMPGNVMVTEIGLVKVLDWGLAELTEARAGTAEALETLTEEVSR